MGLFKHWSIFRKAHQSVLPTHKETPSENEEQNMETSESIPQSQPANSGVSNAPIAHSPMPLSSPMTYGAVDYTHEDEPGALNFNKLDLERGQDPAYESSPPNNSKNSNQETFLPSDGDGGTCTFSQSGPFSMESSRPLEEQLDDLELGKSDPLDAVFEADGEARGDAERTEAFGLLSSMVYLTEDGENNLENNLDDSVSVVSDAMTEQELAGELSELNRALDLLESEGPSSPAAADAAASAAAASAALGSSPAGSFSSASVGGPDQFAKNMVKLYNDLAVRLMDAKDYVQALRMLTKAEALLDNDAAWAPFFDAEASDGTSGGGATMDRNANGSGSVHFLGGATGESSLDEVGGGGGENIDGGVGAGAAAAAAAAKRFQLRAITYNNIGCLHKRRGMPQEALGYLQNALALEEGAGNVRDCASTHLNICAALSALNRYKEALNHAERAIVLLQRQLWGPAAASFQDGVIHLGRTVAALGAGSSTTTGTAGGGGIGTAAVSGTGTSSDDARHRYRRLIASVSVLSMAYHNAAVEHERLGRLREAQVSYSRACTLGMRFLGAKSATTVALNKAQKAFVTRQQGGGGHSHGHTNHHSHGHGHGHHAGAGASGTGTGARKGPSVLPSSKIHHHGQSTTTKIRQTTSGKRTTSVLGGSSSRGVTGGAGVRTLKTNSSVRDRR